MAATAVGRNTPERQRQRRESQDLVGRKGEKRSTTSRGCVGEPRPKDSIKSPGKKGCLRSIRRVSMEEWGARGEILQGTGRDLGRAIRRPNPPITATSSGSSGREATPPSLWNSLDNSCDKDSDPTAQPSGQQDDYHTQFTTNILYISPWPE